MPSCRKHAKAIKAIRIQIQEPPALKQACHGEHVLACLTVNISFLKAVRISEQGARIAQAYCICLPAEDIQTQQYRAAIRFPSHLDNQLCCKKTRVTTTERRLGKQ